MALADYTTFDDIRAALGVTTDEITDTTLSLELYESNLVVDLGRAGAQVMSTYATVKQTDVPARTDVQKAFFMAVRLFATYSVAKALLPALPLAAPKEVSDGQTTLTRFSGDPYKETCRMVQSQYDSNRTFLLDALAAVQSSGGTVNTVLPVFFTVSGLSSDPVTGD